MPGFIVATFVVTLLTLAVLRGLGLVRQRRALAAFLAVAAVAHAGWLSATAFRAHPSALEHAGSVFATAWTVACLITIVTGVPVLLARAVLALAARVRTRGAVGDSGPAARGALANPSRRALFASVGPLAAVAASGRGSVAAVAPFVVMREEIRVKDLPAALDGFKIGQLTDIHVGPYVTVAELARAVRVLDDEGVHLLAMTGDLLDDIEEVDACLDALEATRAPHGCLAVMGNHEMWRGHDRVLAAYAARAPRGRLRLLLDESVTLEHSAGGAGEASAPLRVVGVDWPSRSRKRGRMQPDERRERMARSAEAAFAGAGDETVLCLTHHPDFFPFAAARGAALTLAGHTHGGQVALLGVPLFGFAFDHMLGRYARPRGPRDDAGDAHLYVGGGMGHWVPYRFGVPAEITVLTLRRA